MKVKYSVGGILDVEIKKIVPKGYGLAFVEDLTVFVPLSAAGDRVRVRIEQIKGQTAFAEIEEIIEASPERIEPPCPYFGTCGGCNFQQMDYAEQLRAKLGIIRDALERIGKIEYAGDIEIVESPLQFEYRSRAMWHVDTRSKRIGYYRRNTRALVDIEHCPILTPELNAVLKNLRNGAEWENFWSERVSIEAANGDNGEISIFSPELNEPTNEISFRSNGETYFYSAKNFFQGNRFLIERMIETALGESRGELALDLYCGVGLFTLPLARRFGRVIGVEASELAIDLAERNRANAELGNIDLYPENVRDFLASAETGKPDLILLDPPRAGTEKAVIAAIIALNPAEIAYVSCEPAGLARDLRKLTDAGYGIVSVTAFDLFPQTHHVETIVRLTRII